ncbi:threonine-phosphate decarboxylase CobD [uncultured Ruthenibacterium sp.]|uniref:threonine-phosphate decarboxylase CobD n=1 Tax=uncultured Ruthenibacterium sp. TaxID=1905347 RepID=UPI00349E8075
MGANLVHGGDWAGFLREYGKMPLDFSANVSPLGLPEGVRRAIQDSLDDADRYPDPLCRRLRQKLSAFLEVPMENILCGNGAADLIFRLVAAVRPQRALVTAPTFSEYEQALKLANCEVDSFLLCPENDFSISSAILEKIQPGLDVLFLCEPNNPTGRTTSRELLMCILEKCKFCGTMLVVDECFNDFLDCPLEHTLQDALPSFKNLIILRAFTKWYAMAGIRLGYALCSNEEVLERMRQSGQPWAVSTLAQAAGSAALDEKEYSERLRQLVAEQRPALMDGLRALGCRVIPGQANYLLFYHPNLQLAERLRQRGVLVRMCKNYPGLGDGWYRVAVRTKNENHMFLQILKEVL